MFSLIQTAIENGLDPYQYLTWLPEKHKQSRPEKSGYARKAAALERTGRMQNKVALGTFKIHKGARYETGTI